MDTDKSQVEQSENGSDSSSADVKSTWRTALFVTLVVLAGAVAAHSVLTNGGKNSPCGWGTCAIDQGNGNGYTCSKTSACAVDQGNGGATKTACCPLGEGNGNGDSCSKPAACSIDKAACPGEKAACCPLEGNGNGDGACCPSEKQACPMEATSGCCSSEAPADPAPQPAPIAPTGCCPGI